MGDFNVNRKKTTSQGKNGSVGGGDDGTSVRCHSNGRSYLKMKKHKLRDLRTVVVRVSSESHVHTI